MTARVGVDIGGTFTDCVAVDSEGTFHVSKVTTTSPQSQGMIEAIERTGTGFTSIVELMHGTTVATNAILERKGGPAGLVVTRGFGDLLGLQRGTRERLYHLDYSKSAPLVPRNNVVEVEERIGSAGEVVEPLNMESVMPSLQALVASGVGSVGVCLLFSYLNPRHEIALRDAILTRWPELSMSLSSEVAPEWKEFERASTTAVNAYLVPVVARYLDALRLLLRERALSRDFFVMQSNGGLMTSAAAGRFPFKIVGSGPAAGAQAAATVAVQAGCPEALTLDMGGTSTDVAVVEGGEVAARTETEIEHGLPLKGTALDVHSIGSGAGSIAYVDRYGSLRVGPESAGAFPGPASYGRGGKDATFTDAAVVLNWLDPGHALGSEEVAIDVAAATRAVGRVARATGTTVEDAADGIIRVGIEKICSACWTLTVGRGRDPRTMALVAFGGAGPLVASFVARTLRVRTFIIPPYPGAHSALGLVSSNFVYDVSRTMPTRSTEASEGTIEEVFHMLEEDARQLLAAEGLSKRGVQLVRTIDARYAGQTHEVQVRLPRRAFDLARALQAFHRRHAQLYSYRLPNRAVELVTFRVSAIAARALPMNGAPRPQKDEVPSKLLIRVGSDVMDSRCVARTSIPPNVGIAGPAIIQQMDSTILLLPGDQGHHDSFGNLIVNRR